jgi:hypothetical protein
LEDILERGWDHHLGYVVHEGEDPSIVKMGEFLRPIDAYLADFAEGLLPEPLFSPAVLCSAVESHTDVTFVGREDSGDLGLFP